MVVVSREDRGGIPILGEPQECPSESYWQDAARNGEIRKRPGKPAEELPTGSEVRANVLQRIVERFDVFEELPADHDVKSLSELRERFADTTDDEVIVGTRRRRFELVARQIKADVLAPGGTSLRRQKRRSPSAHVEHVASIREIGLQEVERKLGQCGFT